MQRTLSEKSSQVLQPIENHPEYREKLAVVDRLKKELNLLTDEQTALVNRANQYRRPSVQVMADAYLSGDDLDPSPDLIERNRKINDLRLRITALYLAVEQAEKDLRCAQMKVSAAIDKEQAASVRSAARIVIGGMLAAQRGNEQICALIQERRDLGYATSFHPVGFSPWPHWGNPKEESSLWRFILREFVEAGYITPSEQNRIHNGILTFEP